MKDKVLGEMKKMFRPEFLNRIDATIVFHSLRQEQIRQIVDLMLTRVHTQLTEQQMNARCHDDAKDFLVDEGLRPAVRRAADAPGDPEPDRGSAGRGPAARQVPARRHRRGGVREGTVVLEVQERRDDLLRGVPPPPEAALSAGGSESESSR